MRPLDTSPAAHRAQIDAYRRMGGEARLALALRLGDELRETLADGVRARDPSLTGPEVEREVARLLLGEPLFRAAIERDRSAGR